MEAGKHARETKGKEGKELRQRRNEDVREPDEKREMPGRKEDM